MSLKWVRMTLTEDVEEVRPNVEFKVSKKRGCIRIWVKWVRMTLEFYQLKVGSKMKS